MGYPQPPTLLQTDNTTSTCYSNGTIKQKHTWAMDMHFHQVRDRVKQGQFCVYWGPRYQNLVDWLMKHHSPAHHKRIGERYIHTSEQLMNRAGIRDFALRGLVGRYPLPGNQKLR
jgi:hypothetical protein